MGKLKENSFIIQENIIIVTTLGKNVVDTIVDKVIWEKYLYKYKWNAIKDNNGRITVVTSIGGVTKSMHRFIVECELDELWTFGRFVDHKNNNTLDNRLSNLRTVSHKINNNNISSKREHSHIYNHNSGFVVKMNINDNLHYKYFENLEEAIDYRDNILIPLKKEELKILEEKERKFDFERGLSLMIQNNEENEILEILKKYNISF